MDALVGEGKGLLVGLPSPSTILQTTQFYGCGEFGFRVKRADSARNGVTLGSVSYLSASSFPAKKWER